MAWPYGAAKKKVFRSARHGDVTLYRSVWAHITEKNHRKLVELNNSEIGPTLRDPDEIRQSQHARDKNAHVYYRKPPRLRIGPGATVSPSRLWFAVWIDAEERRIKTMYMTDRRTGGKVIYKRPR